MCRWVRLLVSGAVFALGCGAPLVDSTYGGEPKLTLTGRMEGAAPEPDQQVLHFRGALFWNPRGTAAFDSFDALLEQPSSSRPFQWPGVVEWNVFGFPASEQLATTPSGARYGVAVALFYNDSDNNLRRDPGEKVYAELEYAALVFAPEALAAGDSPTGRAMPAGYHIVSRPFSCAPPTAPGAEEECGVPLGAVCQTDSDCGARGVCLAGGPWWPTDGFCAVPEPSSSGCRPRGGALWRDSRDPRRAFWVQACQAPTDCQRGYPFQCDYTYGACLPTAFALVYGERDLAPQPLCAASP